MKIPTTTQFELNEVTAVLVAHNRRARYGVADYKRMIWQASKAGCPVIAALAARMLMVRMSAPVEILKERFMFTIKGRPDFAFTTAMVAYVEYLVALMDAEAAAQAEAATQAALKKAAAAPRKRAAVTA